MCVERPTSSFLTFTEVWFNVDMWAQSAKKDEIFGRILGEEQKDGIFRI